MNNYLSNGFVKLPYWYFEHPIYRKIDYNIWYIELLRRAVYANKIVEIAGQIITLLPGQLVISRDVLARELQNCSVQKVRTFLKYCEKNNLIELETSNLATIVTVLQYENFIEYSGSVNKNQPAEIKSSSVIESKPTSLSESKSATSSYNQPVNNQPLTSETSKSNHINRYYRISRYKEKNKKTNKRNSNEFQHTQKNVSFEFNPFLTDSYYSDFKTKKTHKKIIKRDMLLKDAQNKDVKLNETQFLQIAQAFQALIRKNLIENHSITKNIDKEKLSKSLSTIRLMIENDNISRENLINIFYVLENDEFWKKNILSIHKIREKADKLLIKYNELKNGTKKNTGITERDLHELSAIVAKHFNTAS